MNGMYRMPCLSNQYSQWLQQKKAENALGRCGTSSGHITKLKQSIFFRYLWVKLLAIFVCVLDNGEDVRWASVNAPLEEKKQV